MSSPGKFTSLLDDYVDDLSSVSERKVLLQMVRSGEYQGILEEHITAQWAVNIEGPVLHIRQKEEILEKIFAEARLAAPVIAMHGSKRPVWRWAAAAAILVTIGAGAWLWSYRSNSHDLAVSPGGSNAAPATATIMPGGYRATLTLADASVINLDGKAQKGTLLRQGGVEVTNVGGKQLVYTGERHDNKPIVFNKVSTPRGGQYEIVLPDGSKVWLNASSTLRFPIAFAGGERNVQLTGEAYFDINAHPAGSGGQQKAPFTVTVNGEKVTVLGTHFNVMAYGEEGVTRTTLLQGAVKITSGPDSKLLKPGEQASLAADGTLTVAKADVEKAMAWKNGFFDGADVPTVMRQISRWYDVDIIYQHPDGPLPPADFGGEISRDETIVDLVRILETNGIHVRLEAQHKRIVVLN